MVGRDVAIVLGTVCILLIAGLGGAIAYYTVTINNKNTAYTDYVSGHSHTNSEFDMLNSSYQNYAATHSHNDSEYDSALSNYSNYVANHHHTDSDYDSLQSNYSSLLSSYDYLKQPHLVSNLDVTDNVNLSSVAQYFYVSGTIINIGFETAYNSTLYVEGWQSSLLALNTTIALGTVNYGSFVYVDSSIPYYGRVALSGWRIWSQPAGIDWTWIRPNPIHTLLR